MRILSLGFPLPGVALDNYSFAGAPALFDYDAVIVDQGALGGLIEDVANGTGDYTLRSGERVVAGSPGAREVSLADLVQQRRSEAERLLSNGGLAIVLARPCIAYEVFDLYSWLPPPDAVAYNERSLCRGTGTEFAIVDDAHPFAAIISSWREKLAYQVYFDLATAHTIARSSGGAPVAIQIDCAGGHIVMLPPSAKPLAGDQRYAFSEALQTAVRQTLRQAAPGSAPAWLAAYATPASGGENAASAACAPLLWQEGRHGLEEPVRAALATLGFRVAPDDVDKPAQLQSGGQATLLEVEGSTSAVGIEAHYRLRARLEEAIARGRPKRGVLVINGFRAQDPADRRAQYTEPLRIAAETMRYCVVTSTQLYHAVLAAGAGDAERADRFREALLTTDGVLRDD